MVILRNAQVVGQASHFARSIDASNPAFSFDDRRTVVAANQPVAVTYGRAAGLQHARGQGQQVIKLSRSR